MALAATPAPATPSASSTPSADAANLTQLSDDVLALVATRVVLNGEAVWLALTCRAANEAVRSACGNLKLERPTTHLFTVFASLRRLRAGMRLESVSAQLSAATAPGSEHLPQSLDGLHRWSPAACRAIVAGATVDVLDYVWPRWQRSIDLGTPSCALVRICEVGRVDLLDNMLKSPAESPADMQCLARVLRLAVDGMPSACERVLHAILTPLVRGISHRTGQWLYDRLEEIGESVESYYWRTWLNDERRARVLVIAATKSHSPLVALRMLTGWLMPRFASRAPSERMASMDTIIQHVLVILASGGVSFSETHYVWQWLSEAWPLGLAHLLRHAHAHSGAVCRELRVSMVHRNCMRVRDLQSYEWMRERVREGAWLHEAVCSTPRHAPWTLSSELVDMKREAARAGPRFALAHHVFYQLHGGLFHESPVPGSVMHWTQSRPIMVQAFCDMLLYDGANENDGHGASYVEFGTSAMLEVSVSAFVDAMKLFCERASDGVQERICKAMMPLILQHLQKHELQPRYHREPDESDDDEQRSAAWNFINSLRCQYGRPHLDRPHLEPLSAPSGNARR